MSIAEDLRKRKEGKAYYTYGLREKNSAILPAMVDFVRVLLYHVFVP